MTYSSRTNPFGVLNRLGGFLFATSMASFMYFSSSSMGILSRLASELLSLKSHIIFSVYCSPFKEHCKFKKWAVFNISTLAKIFSRRHITILFFLIFHREKGFDSSCKLSPTETICMNFQILFSGKNKKNINLSSAQLAQRVEKVKKTWTITRENNPYRTCGQHILAVWSRLSLCFQPLKSQFAPYDILICFCIFRENDAWRNTWIVCLAKGNKFGSRFFPFRAHPFSGVSSSSFILE